MWGTPTLLPAPLLVRSLYQKNEQLCGLCVTTVRPADTAERCIAAVTAVPS